MSVEVETRSRILDVAERLVQTRGFNAFSYADVAAEVGVTKPALHYHFAGKAELGEALVSRYASRFCDALDHISSDRVDGRTKLKQYVGLYAQVLAQERMCLCGMMAADFHTLPEPMKDAVIRFFDENEVWLTGILNEGKKDGSLRFSSGSREAARSIVGALEGAMLVARIYRDVRRFTATAAQLLAEFSV